MRLFRVAKIAMTNPKLIKIELKKIIKREYARKVGRLLFLIRCYKKKVIIYRLDKDIDIILNLEWDVDYRICSGHFEPEVEGFIKQFLKPGMCFFDVGANIGQYTLIGSKYVGINGQMHSFEPAPKMFERLITNVKINQLSNVTLNNTALSDYNGYADLKICNDNAYNSIGNSPMMDVINVIKVKCTTLDEYVKLNFIEHIDLIKIDAEGAELNILKGATNIISRPYAPIIICEYNPNTSVGFDYKPNHLKNYLHSFGYEVFEMTEEGNLKIDTETKENRIAIKKGTKYYGLLSPN